MQCAQRGITGRNVVYDDPKAVNIHHFGKTQFFSQHFLMDAVQVFLAAFDFGFNIDTDQTLTECTQHFADNIAAIFAAVVHGFFQGFVASWVEVLER